MRRAIRPPEYFIIYGFILNYYEVTVEKVILLVSDVGL